MVEEPALSVPWLDFDTPVDAVAHDLTDLAWRECGQDADQASLEPICTR
jgi:hypothetical protein